MQKCKTQSNQKTEQAESKLRLICLKTKGKLVSLAVKSEMVYALSVYVLMACQLFLENRNLHAPRAVVK